MITLRRLVDRWDELVAHETAELRAVDELDWHAAVMRVALGTAGPTTLVRIAERRGKSADWVRETLAREAALQDHDLAEDRERQRVMLLDDRVRLAARPDTGLTRWQRESRALDALADVPLRELGRHVARTVLVTSRAEHAHEVISRLATAEPTDRDERTAIVDAVNALECAGVEIPEPLRERVRDWIQTSASAGALLLTSQPGPFRAYRMVWADVDATIAYLVAAAHAHAVVATVEPALAIVAEQLDLDEARALWLARAAWHGLDEQPLGQIAARAHAWLWGTAAALETARNEAKSRVRSFPLDRTIANGAYRIDRWLLGTGSQRLFAGTEIATGARVQIAFDDHSPGRQDPAELRAAVAYDAPGLLELLHVGPLDDDAGHWAIVERVSGDWLPHVLAPADREEIARQAERIVAGVVERGIDLAGFRPELMWARREGGRLELTGLSTRAVQLFRRSRADARSLPVFDSPPLDLRTGK